MKHTAKKCILLLAGLALAAVLSGCTFFDSSVEQLFTLPRMAEEYTGLSQQIDSLIDQGYEYASPSGGRNIQSVQMVDLEDDGIQEALVFLRQPKSRTMSTRSVRRFRRIAPRRRGSWQNTVRQLPMVLAGWPFSVTDRLSRTSSTLRSGAKASAALMAACRVASGKL